MSGFTADWLTLREPADLAARNRTVEHAYFEALPGGTKRLLDLASGAGSTLAAIAERAGSQTGWILTDHETDLLSVAAKRFAGNACSVVETRCLDLQVELENLPLDMVDGVTTSAFLDLVSETFLHRLASKLAERGLPFLASMTYDGRAELSPTDPFDAELLAALNRHQMQDKGIGVALGPLAAAKAIEVFQDHGYRVVSGTSDWVLGADEAELSKELLRGWTGVGREFGLPAPEIEAWEARRNGEIDRGVLTVRVGHTDFAATKPLGPA